MVMISYILWEVGANWGCLGFCLLSGHGDPHFRGRCLWLSLRFTPGVKLDAVDFAFVNSVRRIFRLSSLKRPETQPIATEDDHKALERFVLALSDQQLVTGLAILLAGFGRCDISLCSFSLVFIVLRIHRCDCKTVVLKRPERATGQTTAGPKGATNRTAGHREGRAMG